MLQQFILDWKLNKKSFFAMLAVLPGLFLLGFGMVALIMNLDDDPGSWFCMGTLLAAIGLCFMALLTYAFTYFQQMQLALSMGRVRMAFLGAYALRMALFLAVGFAIVLVLHQVELVLYPLLFPQFGNEVAFAFLTDWRVIVPVFAGLLLLSLFIGALYGRYGKKSLLFFYILWMFGCFILPRMFDAEATDTGVLDVVAYRTLTFVKLVPLHVWLPLGAVLAVGMLVSIIRFNQVQMVK